MAEMQQIRSNDTRFMEEQEDALLQKNFFAEFLQDFFWFLINIWEIILTKNYFQDLILFSHVSLVDRTKKIFADLKDLPQNIFEEHVTDMGLLESLWS
jgi:hypothetical protein